MYSNNISGDEEASKSHPLKKEIPMSSEIFEAILANWDRLLFFTVGAIIGYLSVMSRDPRQTIRCLTGIALCILVFRYFLMPWMQMEYPREYEFAVSYAWGTFVLAGGFGFIRIFCQKTWQEYIGN